MGVETLSAPIVDASIPTRIDAKVPIGINRAEISPKRLFNKELRPLQLMEDEFKPRDIPILKPLKTVTIIENNNKYRPDDPRNKVTVDITDKLAEDFEHLSKTKNLETGTTRTKVLQELVLDRFTEGTDIQTRVVIMNKGVAAEAFVTPDGTVFISQSLLNKLDSLDEVAGALAHEVSHLIFKTSAKAHEAGAGKEFGVGWVHEAACDAKAPELLEKAGFNSLAFATAIEKISGAERGSIHQSGLTRASQSLGQHLAIDRQTSSINLTPIPPSLKGEVRKTNLEIINEIIQGEPESKTQKAKEHLTGNWKKEYSEALALLNPRDLEQVYQSVYKNKWYRNENFDTTEICENLITTRLQQAGYSRADSLFFLINNMPGYSKREAKLIKTVNEFSDIANGLEEFENTDKFRQMHKLVFGWATDGSRKSKDGSPADVFMKVLNLYQYDIDFEKREDGVPVTREALIDALDKVNQINNSSFDPDKARLITQVLSSYITKTYLTLTADAGEIVDINQLKTLFEEFKSRGIELVPGSLAYHFNRSLSVKYYGKDLHISDENKNIVKQAFNEVFEIQAQEEKEFGYKEIDDFFKEYNKFNEPGWEQFGFKDNSKIKNLRDFVRDLRVDFDKNKLTDEQRLAYLEYITQKIDSSQFQSDRSLLKYLEDNDHYNNTEITPTETSSNNLISRFNLKMIIAVSMFERDGSEFYSFLQQAMNNSGLDPNQLSRTQLINLCQGLFALDTEPHSPGLYWYGQQTIDSIRVDKPVSLKDYDALFNLPFIAKIMERDQDLNITNIKDLNSHIESQLQRTHRPLPSDRFDLFQENLLGLVIGRAMRDNFSQLLDNGIKEAEYADFYQFIDRYYSNGPQKDQFQREINKLYLNSPNISIEDKTDYLVRFFDKVGPEGMVIVANEIKDIKTYRAFREKIGTRVNDYLEGSGLVSSVAFADLLSSSLVGSFDELLQTTTTTPKTTGEISTTLAKEWFDKTLSGSGSGETIPYDKDKEKFFLDEKRRAVFRTFNDLATTLKNFTPLQRFGIAHKALVDTRGALTSPGSRAVLGKRLVESLGLGKGFVSSVLVAACQEADAKLIGFPAASMLSPLLFRAVDVNAVNIKEVGKATVYGGDELGYGKLSSFFSDQEIANILRADTRGITVFGLKYQANPESPVAQLTQESDQKYHQITDKLDALFKESQSGETKQPTEKAEIDPAMEAVIRGVETSGALGIRALQLATQFHTFSPALEKRLSDTFDSNPGLNKLLFWENLNKLAEEDQAIGAYMERVTLGDYLGGGSLQTTYGATYRDDAGSERAVILKMKNPNVEAFIREGYISAHRSLEVVSKQRFAGKAGENARTGMALMDLAQKWCLDDINDKSFEEDDDLFRQTIDKYNSEKGTDQFFAPERVLTYPKLKSEDLAPGKTVNQLLNDESVGQETKKEVVEMLGKFFVYQFRGNSFNDADGKRYFLVHSDPHIGNYVADVSGEKPKVGVIDRSLYLRLEDKDVAVLEKLMVQGNNTEFADSFINRILDINKVRGVQRVVVKNMVFGKLAIEAAQQMARGGVNRFTLMRSMLTELSNSKMDVPLNLRLMIRNIGAFQELTRRYGVNLEQLDQQTA